MMRMAILGASGLVGRTMLQLLAEAPWVDADPLLLGSARSAGTSLLFRGRELPCREVTAEHFDGIEVALFSAGGGPSRTWGPVAVAAGSWVVDNSSAFRMDSEVPLIVPEINGELLVHSSSVPGIIANPNCSTIQVAMALAPLDRLARIREVQVTTMQAVSGAGQAAVAELTQQLADPQSGQTSPIFPRTIAGNVIPAIGAQLPDGSYEEEAKVERELRKILGRGDDLAVTCTATRVPVFNGHSAAVRVVCEEPITPESAAEALQPWPGLELTADPHGFSTAVEISGGSAVHVGRLRADPSNKHALLLWVVADNLLKGAALNAVQIAKLLAERPGR